MVATTPRDPPIRHFPVGSAPVLLCYSLLISWLVALVLLPRTLAVAVMLASVGAVLAALAFRVPKIAVCLLAAMIYGRVSDTLIDRGLPSTLQPVLAVVVVGLLYRAIRSRTIPAGWELAALLLGLYGVVLATGLVDPVVPAEAAYLFGVYLRDVVVVLVVVVLLAEQPEGLRWAIWSVVATAAVLSLLGIYQYATGNYGQTFLGFALAPELNIAGAEERGRIAGPVGDPNIFAQALVAALPLAFGRATWGSSTTIARLLGVIASALILMATVFTYSRGAFVAVAATIVLVTLRAGPPRWFWLLMGGGGVVGFFALPSDYQARLLSLTNLTDAAGSGEASLSGRLSATLGGIDMFTSHPLIGVGIGDSFWLYPEYARGHGVNTLWHTIPPHSFYLELLAETGLLGALTMGAILTAAIFGAVRASRHLRAHRLHAYSSDALDVACALGGYLIAGLFVHNAYPRYFWFLIGLCLALPTIARRLTTDER